MNIASPRHFFATLSVTGLGLLAALPAQNASFSTFGTSCQFGLSLSSNDLPRLGQSFRILYSGIIGDTFSSAGGQLATPFLLMGFSTTNSGGVSLPYLLPPAMTRGVTNCELLVSADVTLSLSVQMAPPFQVTIAIPNDVGLVGTTFHMQWMTAIRNTNGPVITVQSVALSNAGTAVVGH